MKGREFFAKSPRKREQEEKSLRQRVGKETTTSSAF